MAHPTATLAPCYNINIERTFHRSLADVWTAISDKDAVAAWMEYPAAFTPVLGAELFIDFAPEEPIRGVVCALEREKLFAYTWRDSIVKWALQPADGAVVLQFSHIAVQPDFVAGLAAGWHCFLDNLGAYLTGASFADDFDALLPKYQKTFARALST